MPRELPPGYTEAPKKGRELPPGYTEAPPAAAAPESVLDRLTKAYASGLEQRKLPAGASFPEKAAAFVGEEGPVIAGAAKGLAMGIPGGPGTAAIGAALGGATGRMAQKTAAAGLGALEGAVSQAPAEERLFKKEDESIVDAIKDVAFTGMLQGAGAQAGQLVGEAAGVASNTKAAQWIGTKLAEGAGQLGSLLNAVPERIGTAIAKNMGKFVNAPTQEMVSQMYDDFYAAASQAVGSPVMGRRQLVRMARQPITGNQPGALIDDVQKALVSKDAGTLTLQEAISGSQAAVKLRSPKLRGNETAQAVAEEITTAKQELDDWLEANVPQALQGQWKAVREANFWKEAREAYDSFFPQNVNRSSNKLRGTLGLSGGGYTGFAAGGPLGAAAGAALGTAIQAPILYGRGVIPAAYYAGKATEAVIPAARAALSQRGGQSLADYYNRRRMEAR